MEQPKPDECFWKKEVITKGDKVIAEGYKRSCSGIVHSNTVPSMRCPSCNRLVKTT